MTENKRFILVDIGFVRDNGKLIGMKDIVTVMNELHEENEQLKARIGYLERKTQTERNSTQKQYEKWEKEALEKINKLEKENAFLTVKVETLRQIKPIRKLPRELTVLKVDNGDV